MGIWRKEKENQIDAVTQLENELEIARQKDQGEGSESEAELSLEEQLMLEAEEEICAEKQAEIGQIHGDAGYDEAESERIFSEEALSQKNADDITARDIAAEECTTAEAESSEALSANGSANVQNTESKDDKFKIKFMISRIPRLEFGTMKIPRWALGMILAAVGIFLIFWGVSRFSAPVDTEEETEPSTELAMVSEDYIPALALNLDGEPEAAPISYEQMINDMRGWVCEFGRINIRDEASFDGKVVDYVVYGDRLKIYEQEGEFTRIKYISPVSGKLTEGYCYTEYISDTEPEGAQVYLNIPLYKQADYRWGAVKIGGYETLASAGCTTTCIAMVETYMTGEEVYPDDVVDMLYYTYDGRLTFPERYTHHWARDYMSVAVKKLHEGIPVLVSGYNSAGGTHWVVLVAYKGDGEDFSSDLFLINDPGSPRTTLTDFMRDYPFIEKIVYYNK
ncbi:MAG: C39 family peptidase [Lachnospiraceae bacterium]|nr:C39 family peptidase [Lachnospiraceae bacterium]